MAKLRLIVALLLTIGLLGIQSFAPASGATDEAAWSQSDIPADGEDGDWVLAAGSDVTHLALAADGTLYAAVDGLSYTLYVSQDGGYSWQHIGNVSDTIVDIAVSDATGAIYYATAGNVYRSTDDGDSFQPIASASALNIGGNVGITSIDVGRGDDNNVIAVGTRDTDSGQYGGVYILEEGAFPQWFDTGIGDYDVYAVAFSPDFDDDQQIVAVVTDETDSFVVTKMGNTGWGQVVGDARLDRDNSGASLAVAVSADIAFPDNYNSQPGSSEYIQYVAVSIGGGDGDVYAIYGEAAPGDSDAVDLNAGSGYGLANIDITSLAVCGDGTDAILLASAADEGQVYRSLDGGDDWVKGLKKPTGQSDTQVVMAADFAAIGIAYAATSGYESAVSVTPDGGDTWNQIGLADTGMDAIIDLAVPSEDGQDDALFMLTWGSGFSLWRSLDGGGRWQRVFSSAMDGVDSIDFVSLSPEYGSGSRVLFLAGSSGGDPAVWKSSDNGQSFDCNEAPMAIDQWVIADNTTLFIAAFDGDNGIIYKSSNSGLSYSPGTITSEQPITSIALSPEYEQDDTILVGNGDGWVYYSDDDGDSFQTLPVDAASSPLEGNIVVAFDADFGDNGTVYAASDSPGEGIYRFVIGESTEWESIDDSLPAGAMIGGLAVSDDGVLYAANFQQVYTGAAKGGMERCLEPGSEAETAFDTVAGGLDDGATLVGLWLCGNRVWSIDTTNLKLAVYYDSLTQPVVLTSPDDQSQNVGVILNNFDVEKVRLDWETLDGADRYQWQVDDDSDFSSVMAGFNGTTTASSVELPELDQDTTYYWRVRAVEPVLSPWSEAWSFTTIQRQELDAPQLQSPSLGAVDVPVSPLFQWSAVDGAEGYELLVCSDTDFNECEISMVGGDALSGNSWQADVALEYHATYYWRVRAVNDDTIGDWSDIGVFTTGDEPEPTPTLTTTTEPTTTVPTTTIPTTTTPTTTMPTTTIPTTTVATTTSPTSLPTQTNSGTSDWIYYVIGSIGAIVVIGLAVMLVRMVRRRRLI